MMEEIKQVIIIRSDLEMSKGKAVAQGAHSAIRAFEIAQESTPRVVSDWQMQGEKKIAVKAPLTEMQSIFSKAKKARLPCALIQDAGLTQLEPGTITALAIGPAKSADIDALTKHLKLL